MPPATDDFADLLACPECRRPLSAALACDACGWVGAWEGAVPVFIGREARAEMARGDGRWARWSEAIRGLDAWRARRAKSSTQQPDFVDPRIAKLLQAAAPRGVVADVGGADGAKLRAMPAAVTRYLSLDPCARAQPARREGCAGLSARALAEALPLSDRSIDAVFSTGAMDYFVDPARAVGEFARVLKPGGTLAVLVTVHPAPVARARSQKSRARRAISSFHPSVLRAVGVAAGASLAWDGAVAAYREHTRYLGEDEVLGWLDARFERRSLERDPGRYSTVLRYVGALKSADAPQA